MVDAVGSCNTEEASSSLWIVEEFPAARIETRGRRETPIETDLPYLSVTISSHPILPKSIRRGLYCSLKFHWVPSHQHLLDLDMLFIPG